MSNPPDQVDLNFYARLTGFMYVFSNFTATLGYWVRSQVMVGSDPAATANNLLSLETLFRFGIAAELVTVVATTTLIVGSYTILKRQNAALSMLAMVIRLIENAVLVSLTFVSFIALGFLQSAAGPASSIADLSYALVRVHMYGFQVGFLFLGIGSALFSWLWLQSRLIPKPFALLGIFASTLMAIVSIAVVIQPSVLKIVTLAYMAPMGLFEVGLGLWLLFRGLSLPGASSIRAHHP